jgi:hypothetical protein
LATQDLHLKKRATLSRNDDRSGSIPSTHIAIIASGGSLSGGVDLGEETLVGIIMPSAWTAADITFQVSNDNVTFYNLYDKDAEVTLTSPDASLAVAIDPVNLYPWQYVKVRSGTAATPVNQADARSITLLSKPV